MGPVSIILLTMLSITAYIVIFIGMVQLFTWSCDNYSEWTMKAQLLSLLPLIALGTVVIVLDLIHTIALALMAIHTASQLRDWWHRGSK